MDRIFMTRDEAIRLLLEAHQILSGNSSATFIKPSVERSAKLEALDRLLLDVRAGRVDEFRINADDRTRVAITD